MDWRIAIPIRRGRGMNGLTQLNVANAALHAKRTRQAIEEQTAIMRGERDEAIRRELNAQWHEILVERDRVWKETADRLWRMGWESGFNSGAEWQREQPPA